LAELKEYALEVDMDFVRRAVKAIGQAAIKIESASERCVNTLVDLINTKVNYVVQEAIVVIADIFRKYPGYEGIIPTLCQCIDELDEPNARGSLRSAMLAISSPGLWMVSWRNLHRYAVKACAVATADMS